MTSLTEEWLQDTAAEANLPALHPAIGRILLPVVEMEVKRIVQQAVKFQRRAKCSKSLTVEDINLALSMNRYEEIYGLTGSSMVKGNLVTVEIADGTKHSSGFSAPITIEATKVDLMELAKKPLPECPLAPDISMHWLAISGTQPRIPENPTVILTDFEDIQPTNLSREMQVFYSRTTGSILAQDSGTLRVVYECFETDKCLQELMPYFSRFIYIQIKRNIRNTRLLECLLKAARCFVLNPSIHLEFHIHQLLPALLTCVVAAHLSNPVSSTEEEDHWALRKNAADVVSLITKKYKNIIPDLHARICKTYLDAFAEDKSLASLYGGIVGLCALGHSVVKTLLIPSMSYLSKRLKSVEDISATSSSSSLSSSSVVAEDGDPEQNAKKQRLEGKVGFVALQREVEAVTKCRTELIAALGKFMTTSMRVPNAVDLPESANPLSNRRRNEAGENQLVADLGETLVPYFATASNQIDHCKMFL